MLRSLRAAFAACGLAMLLGVACGGDLDGTSGGAGPDAQPARGTECDFSVDCPVVPSAYAGCAVSLCANGRCVLRTKDADADGHRSHQACLPTAGAGAMEAGVPEAGSGELTDANLNEFDAAAAPRVVEVGDDCDDQDPKVFPGEKIRCSQRPDNTQIEFPGGRPQGLCEAGERTCGANGLFSNCIGAKEPAAENTCTPLVDENCDGSNDNSCGCTTSKACGSSAGACKSGMQACVDGKLGPCLGAVGAKSRDCASSADNDCNGKPDNELDQICKCTPNTVLANSCDTHPGYDGKGVCTAGQQTCIAGEGTADWGPCTGSVGPGLEGCGVNIDKDCDGIKGNGPGCASVFVCTLRAADWLRGEGCTSSKLLTGAAGDIALYQCKSQSNPATIYLAQMCPYNDGIYGYTAGQTPAGYVSSINGGVGWVPLAGGYTLE